MKKFSLSAKVTISVYTEVEAETPEDAVNIANKREVEDSEFRGENKNIAWISDEFDGVPFDIYSGLKLLPKIKGS
jgi:hypothetical protein